MAEPPVRRPVRADVQICGHVPAGGRSLQIALVIVQVKRDFSQGVRLPWTADGIAQCTFGRTSPRGAPATRLRDRRRHIGVDAAGSFVGSQFRQTKVRDFDSDLNLAARDSLGPSMALALRAASPCDSTVLPNRHSGHPWPSPLRGGFAVQIGSPADLSNRGFSS